MTWSGAASTVVTHVRTEGTIPTWRCPELDWKAGLHWQDEVLVAVSTARLGRTSFALDFETRRAGGQVTCGARTVYVVVATDGSGKAELPPRLVEP